MSDEEKLTDDLDLQGFNFDDLPDDEQNRLITQMQTSAELMILSVMK